MKLFKKLIACFGIALAAFSLAGCQTTDKNATIRVEDSSYQIMTVQRDGVEVKRLRLVICVDNPTIYNAIEFAIDYACFDAHGLPIIGTPDQPGVAIDYRIKMGVAHGVKGYVYSEFDTFDNLASVKLANPKCTQYQTVWDTYLAWWVIMICIVGVATIFYSANLFARGLTAEDLKRMFADNVTSSLVVLGLCLIIAIIPLIFSSWVVTLIILGGYVGFLLLSGGMTALRLALAKK